MTDPRELREHRDEVLSRLAEGPIHTRFHAVNEALEEVRERRRGEGNRKARRAAAAKARRRG
ncbi:hypothetical protein GGR33_004840 [Methylobacterium brachythecii]|uniref:Uncharacterized protein n=1 Tax=Methylobacterium brachythecii TaxID=1176177 RepID=A0A7W6AKV0_9HYPH|nr:hypothetical protein [Methylobacterium brachythecii]GLS45919.1 hypothetical protein GCM10007884_39100 [Methylobacterium brachythecii]